MAKRRRTNGEGAVYQTKDGRWRATLDLGWEHGKRQRKYLSGGTKAAVGRAVREALAQVESGVPLTRDGAGPTVEEWLWYWHDTIQASGQGGHAQRAGGGDPPPPGASHRAGPAA